MCGIAGIVDIKNRPVEQKTIKTMIDAVAHRGPNGEGVWTGDGVGLGHRRLSILDLSAAGSQPMISSDKTITVILNGEIYNYIELKKELGGVYKSGTDTEVVIHAYQKWGEKCVEKFNGIFSFALWDSKRKIFFAARDRLGVKPFYYSLYQNRFYFGSEIKAILSAGVPAKPNQKIIHEYLSYGYYDHSEETFSEGIKQLQPGCSVTIQEGNISYNRYWYLPDHVKNRSQITDKECVEEFLSLLHDSVRMQLRSDVPVGLSVSGGLDSSLLMATVHEMIKGQKNVDLYHFTYEGKGYDIEVPHVKTLAKHLNWKDPAIVEVMPRDMEDLIARIMHHEEQPFPGVPTVAWHKLYQSLVSTKTIVTFEGHGGDEMAGGYDYYAGSFLLDMIREGGVSAMERELEHLKKVRGLTNDQAMPFFLNGIEAYLRGGVSADASRFVNLEPLNQKFLKQYNKMPKFEAPFESFFSNFQYRELIATKLPRVLRSVDRESMAYGKELRVPLLDHRIVEFAFSLPANVKIREGHQRFFMRKAGEKILPKDIAHTPKRSLPNPQRSWFQKELRPWILNILKSQSFGSRPYFNQKKILAEYETYCKEKNPANSFHIWQWLSIELWHRAFID